MCVKDRGAISRVDMSGFTVTHNNHAGLLSPNKNMMTSRPNSQQDDVKEKGQEGFRKIRTITQDNNNNRMLGNKQHRWITTLGFHPLTVGDPVGYHCSEILWQVVLWWPSRAFSLGPVLVMSDPYNAEDRKPVKRADPCSLWLASALCFPEVGEEEDVVSGRDQSDDVDLLVGMVQTET